MSRSISNWKCLFCQPKFDGLETEQTGNSMVSSVEKIESEKGDRNTRENFLDDLKNTSDFSTKVETGNVYEEPQEQTNGANNSFNIPASIQLSDHEFSHLQQSLEETLNGVLAHEKSTVGWRHRFSKRAGEFEVQCSTKHLENSAIHLVRAQSSGLRADTKDVLRALTTFETTEELNREMGKVDPMYEEGVLLLRKWTSSTDLFMLLWMDFALPGGGLMWNREFLYANLIRLYTDEDTGEQVVVTCGTSIDHPAIPYPNQRGVKAVRGQILNTGYVFREVVPGDIRQTYVVQVDIGGNIPTWIVNLSSISQGMNVGRTSEMLTNNLKVCRSMGIQPYTCKVHEMKPHSSLQQEIWPLPVKDSLKLFCEKHQAEVARGGHSISLQFLATREIDFYFEIVDKGKEVIQSPTERIHKNTPVNRTLEISDDCASVAVCWKNASLMYSQQLYYKISYPWSSDEREMLSDIEVCSTQQTPRSAFSSSQDKGTSSTRSMSINKLAFAKTKPKRQTSLKKVANTISVVGSRYMCRRRRAQTT